MMKRACVVLATILLFACAKNGPPSPSADGGGLASSSASPAIKKDDLPTTSFSIAKENLDGLIAEHQRLDRADAKSRATIVDLLLMRGQFLARVADYESAEEVAERAVKGDPTSPVALLARARVHATFHRFALAQKDIDAAEKNDGDPSRIASARASVLMALGHYEEAAALLPSDPHGPSELTTAAVLAARMQNPSVAEELFERARSAVRDVSPFPVAWMDFQRASVLESAGDAGRARLYYEEAIDKIPAYAHAVVHLAARAPAERAISVLMPLLETSDDPDVLAALADAHRRAKHDPESQRLRDAARARYDALVEKHPEAYADHAARFHLANGEPKKALALAQANARLRPTEEAIDLWSGAATAAHDEEAMCAAAAALDALRFVSADRKRLARATLDGCTPRP